MLKIWNKENPQIIFIFYFLVLSSKRKFKNKNTLMSVDLASVRSNNATPSALHLFLQEKQS
jgi:hypothetical protein